MTLSEYLRAASVEHWAVPHINVSNFLQLQAIAEAARELSAPIMIGTSESEADFFGEALTTPLVRSVAETYHVPLFLNADHYHSVERARGAIDHGYRSLAIDLSKLSYDENVAGVKEVVIMSKLIGEHVSVEGEIGSIVTDSSKIYNEVIEVPEKTLTTPEEAQSFIEATGVHRLAIAVGEHHGIAANKKKIDNKRIANIRAAVPEDICLVLHGGSGLSDKQFTDAIAAGISNIHVSTNVRVIYRSALERSLKEHPDEVASYKYEKSVRDAVKEEVAHIITVFGASGRAVL